jgi:hypothetical protein
MAKEVQVRKARTDGRRGINYLYGLRCFFDFRAYTSDAKSIWGFCEITASQTPKFGKWYYLAVQEQHRGLD